MPPKQKQVKKGPTYKNSISPKDLVTADIKQPPREAKSLKYPQNFPQVIKNQKKAVVLFQSWPTDQAIKTFDFGVSTQTKFVDPHHTLLAQYFPTSQWLSFPQLHKQKLQHQSLQSVNSQQSLHQQKQQEKAQLLKEIVVIQTFQRDQNKEEMEQRLKDQAEKAEKTAKDKKKGKKEEVKEEGPIKVRDVRMVDIQVNKNMAEQGIWIGSQLQIIKLRNIVDTYAREPIWKKIYPQQNGVPQITKSGKYWVKLYYMGEPIKVQIDDRVPMDQDLQQMLPLSQKYNQKWTLIVSKALIKYMSIVCPSGRIAGSGLIFHALTGMICQQLQMNQKDWQRFSLLINDNHYNKSDIIVSCYSNDASPTPPSNKIISSQQMKDFFKLANSTYPNKQQKKKPGGLLDKLGQEGDQIVKDQWIQADILKGYAYCLGDYFQNGQFNMAFCKEKSDKEMKLRIQYNNLAKVNLNTKTRDQKLEHRRKKKQIKQLLFIQQKKRLDFISQEKTNYSFFKLLGNLRIYNQFSQKQILLAKKCLLNNLSQPPNYQMPSQKDQTKSMKSVSMIKTSKQQIQINPNIDDFSSLQNPLQPLIRQDHGIWIKDIDFLTCFTNVQIIYNPEQFTNKTIQRIVSVNQNQFSFDQKKQILVLEKLQMDQEGIQPEGIDLLVGFSYQPPNNKHNTITNHKDNDITNPKDNSTSNHPYFILQKFDFDQFSVTSNVTKLSQKLDSSYLSLKNQNNVFKIYTMCKRNYCFWVSSNAKFKLMSISQYLQQYQGYKKKQFIIQHPSIQCQSYFPISRLSVTSSTANSIILKLPSISPHLSYKLIKPSLKSSPVQGILTHLNQSKYLSQDYTKMLIQSNIQYDLVVECCGKDNIQEGQVQLTILVKDQQNIRIDQSQAVQPIKYVEKYKPNKYGTIFKERIFTNANTRQAFAVKLVEGEEQQAGQNADKKAAKKGGKDQPATQIVQKPMQTPRTIILRLLKNDQILYQTRGTNWTAIPSIRIPNTKQLQNQQYFIQARFDLREWPNCRLQTQQTSKICWVITCFGTDSIALVRDTKLQEKERQTRKGWEENQVGRAQRAKKSRRRFLLLQKKQSGQTLTQQQQLIVSAPRLTKKQQQQQQKAKLQDKNKKGGKKQEKKGGKQVKKQQVQQKVTKITFPKANSACSSDIRSFLRVLQNIYVQRKILTQEDTVKIRSDEQLKAIKQSSIMCQEDRIGKMLKNVQRRQTIKLKERDKKDQLVLYLEDLNKNFKQNWLNYTTWRNQDLQKDKTKQEKERAIVDLLGQDKVTLTEADLDKMLNQYQQIPGSNQKLYDVAVMLKKNIKIANLSQKISGHITGWQIQELKLIQQTIKTQQISGISESILVQMRGMLAQAQKNPNIVVQKQNQAKKAKKGGKK